MSEAIGISMRTAASRWVRHTFVRENLVGALKTFAWLGPLTLVIWVYAERAQVVPVDNVSVPIEVQISDTSKFIARDSNDANIVVKLTGPRSRIEDLQQSIRPTGGKAAVVLKLDSKLSGRVEVDAISLISENPIFKYSGVNVTEARPAQLRAFIDTYEDREIEVRVPVRVTNLVSTPVFAPEKVKVRAPASYFTAAGFVTVEADLFSARVLDNPGTHPVNVRVYSPQLLEYQGVSYTPEMVKTTLEVRAPNIGYKIASLPVNLDIPGIITDQFKVTHPPTIIDVEVSGPPNRIQDLVQNVAKPYVILKVRGEDRPAPGAGAKTVYKQPEIRDLPEGVILNQNPAPVEVTLTERAAS